MKHRTGFLPEPSDSKHKAFETHLLPFLHRHISERTLVVDMRLFSLTRRDQGNTYSCVGHAVVKAIEIREAVKNGVHNVVPLSVLSDYYLARELMFPKQIEMDKGTFVAHACEAAHRFGVCPETDWPFDAAKVNVSPDWVAMREAYNHRLNGFFKITATGQDRVRKVKDALAHSYPVVIGTDVGDNWDNYHANQVLGVCPNPTDKHATVLLGDLNGIFIGENSWGSDWGEQGFYKMDPAVIASDQTYECWIVEI